MTVGSVDITFQGIQTLVELVGLVVILFKAAGFTTRIEARLDTVNDKLVENSSRLVKLIDDHEERIRLVEGQVGEWRGEERRVGPQRRPGSQ